MILIGLILTQNSSLQFLLFCAFKNAFLPLSETQRKETVSFVKHWRFFVIIVALHFVFSWIYFGSRIIHYLRYKSKSKSVFAFNLLSMKTFETKKHFCAVHFFLDFNLIFQVRTYKKCRRYRIIIKIDCYLLVEHWKLVSNEYANKNWFPKSIIIYGKSTIFIYLIGR